MSPHPGDGREGEGAAAPGRPARRAGARPGTSERRITDALVREAVRVADECGAAAIIVPLDALPRAAKPIPERDGRSVLYIARGDDWETPEGEGWDRARILTVPHVPLTRMSLIKITIFLALSHGFISVGDVVVVVAGQSSGGELDTLFATQVSHESESFRFLPRSEQIPAGVSPEVVARTIDIAIEIGAEGREGKPVGALFVVGDTERVLGLSRALVLNPFRGYDEAERNILDAAIEETVKEFSTIDGAFVIRGDGVIEACGVYLKTAASGQDMPHGLGARHHVASGITAVTESMAIAVSESTGTVTIFRSGRILTEFLRAKRLERARDGHLG